MSCEHVYVRYTALAPILHGQPPEKGRRAQTTENRTIKISVAEGGTGKLIDIPVVSGNAIRGAGRRDYVRKILKMLGYYDEKTGLFQGLSGDTLAFMAVGGTMEAGKRERVPLAAGFLQVYRRLPFAALLGGVYKEIFFPGRLAVGFAVPITTGTKRILERMKSPFSEIAIPADDGMVLDNTATRYTRAAAPRDFNITLGSWEAIDPVIQKDEQLSELISDAFAKAEEKGVAKPDYSLLKEYLRAPEGGEALRELAKYFNVPLESRNPKANPVDDVVKKLEKLGELRSIFTVQNTIPAGIELHSRMSLIPGYGNDGLIQMAFDAFVDTVLSRGYLGGMVAKGYGAVEAEAKVKIGEEAKDFTEVSRAEKFWEWLDNNKASVRDFLENLDTYLFGGPRGQDEGGEELCARSA